MANHNTSTPIILAFLGNLIIAVLKFIAAFFSGSAAMFSEGLHSLADTANQAFLLIGLKKSKKPADKEHQFGFGKERFFWSLIAAFGILSIGSVLSIQKGWEALHQEHHVENVSLVLVVLAVSILIETYTLIVAYRYIQKRKGTTNLFKYIDSSSETATITVLFEDTGAVLGLLIAGAGITLTYVTGNPAYDAIASMVIGVLLAGIALFLVNKNKDFLTDQSHAHINKSVEEIFTAHPAVEKWHDLRTIIFGPEHVIVMTEVEFKEEFIYQNLNLLKNKERKNYTQEVIKRIGMLTDQLENQIRKTCPEVKEIYLEVEQTHNKIRFDKALK